jgi:uncharacterized protein YbbC (DUF1343 family)
MIFKGKQQLQILVFTTLFLWLFFAKNTVSGYCVFPGNSPTIESTSIKTGAEQFSQYIWRLKGKRVMIIANQTSVVNGVHLVDTLLKLGINITGVFAPEHGFRGSAANGEHVSNQTDAKTGLPIYSLYGSNYKPTKAQLENCDILVFDIQDVGVRFYTYLTTMHFAMQACSEYHKTFIVLDRPNPNGYFMDGPILQSGLESMVGVHPIPLVHGMTLGELSYMIIGERWLQITIPNAVNKSKNPSKNLTSIIKSEINDSLNLIVVPCKNWMRSQRYSVPIPPSPNLPTDNSILLYPSLGLFEGTIMSMGRGTNKPFECFGAPWLKQGSYTFTPTDIQGKAINPPYKNQLCRGVLLTDFGPSYLHNFKHLYLEWLVMLYDECPDSIKFFNPFFTKLIGNKEVQKMIESGKDANYIRNSWRNDIEVFENKRWKYLLYP